MAHREKKSKSSARLVVIVSDPEVEISVLKINFSLTVMSVTKVCELNSLIPHPFFMFLSEDIVP